MMLIDSVQAVIGTEGSGGDVWATRGVLISGIITVIGAQVKSIVQAIRTQAAVDANAAALAARLDRLEAAWNDHHAENTVRLDAIEAKIPPT